MVSMKCSESACMAAVLWLVSVWLAMVVVELLLLLLEQLVVVVEP
jgi:hypothetical protein